MQKRKLKIHLCCILFAGCFQGSYAQEDKLSENNYRIYSVKHSKEVMLDSIVADMKNHDVLFFGEEHNDSVTHFLQAELFKKLYSLYGNNIALSMEMFETDCQLVLNEYLHGFIREKNFIKEARAWKNYRDYKPLVEFAKEKKLEVIAANAPARYVSMTGRKGRDALLALSKEAKKYLPPLPYDTAAGEYYKKLTEVSHTPAAPATDTAKKISTPPPVQGPAYGIHAQSLWDASMAYSIAEYRKKHRDKKIMQVNGRFHSDERLGTVTQLKKYSPKTKPLIISTESDTTFPIIDWNKYKKMDDYIIITDPKIPRTYKE